MMRITKEFSVDYGHRLMNHPGQCSNIHGHTARILVHVAGRVIPKTGMVVDFGELNDLCKPIIDRFDHALILNEEDMGIIAALATYDRTNPKLKIVLLDREPTAENLAAVLLDRFNDARRHMTPTPNPDEWHFTGVSFYETPKNFASIQ